MIFNIIKYNTIIEFCSMSTSESDSNLYGDGVVIKESIDIPSLNGKISACQTPEGVKLKKVQFDKEKKRVMLKPLNQISM